VRSDGYRAWVDAEGLETEWLSLKTLAGERLMTGLRTRSGVDPSELLDRYGHPLSPSQARHLAEFRKRGLMDPDDPLRLTETGLELADAIILRLLD
jgi:coproporphyrinogen III oxidase-like Fe-S oxidoreductase